MSAIVDKPRLPGAFRYSGKYRRSIRNEYPDQLGHPGYIYCIGSNDFDPVKIGFTVGSPGKRVKEIQTGNPFELEVLFYVPAVSWSEHIYHNVFKTSRIRGEWFSRDGGAVGYMSAATGGRGAEVLTSFESKWNRRHLENLSSLFLGLNNLLFDACDAVPPVNGEWCKSEVWKSEFSIRAAEVTSKYYPSQLVGQSIDEAVVDAKVAIWRYLPPCVCCGGLLRG